MATTITSNNDIVISTPVSDPDAIVVLAGEDGSGSLTITNTGSLTTTNAGSDIILRAGNTTGDISVGGNVSAVDTIDMRAAGTISENIGAALTANSLMIQAGGAVTLVLANNVANLAARLTGAGAFSYNDVDSITITTVAGIDGVSTNNRDIAITTVNGAINGAQTSAQYEVNAGNATVTLSAGSTGSADNAINFVSGADVRGLGGITLTGDNIQISSSSVDAGTAIATLQPFQAGTLINLGGADAANTLGVADGELDNIGAGIVRVGALISGDMTVTAPISPAGTSTLSLQTGGAIVDGNGAGADITETNLALRAATGIGAADDLNTKVSNLAFSNTTSGNVNILNDGALTIGAVDGLSASSNSGGGTTTITATSPLTFAVNTTSVGSATYTAGETNDGPTGADDLTITGTSAVNVTAGDLTLNAGDDIILQSGAQATASGNVVVTAGSGDLDTIGGIDSTGTIQGGDVSLTALGEIRPGRIIATGTASLTSINEGIRDSNATGPDIVATNLLADVFRGVGTFLAPPLDTQVSNLEARTVVTGIYINNTGDLTVGGLSPGLSGLDVLSAGDLSLTNAGSITLADTDGPEIVHGASSFGNVTLAANGASADFSVTVDNKAITA
ncbi:MAG TPA: hypothetical protein VHN20_07990, partial [Beijerinckiaceae bacterium]|nr:hypothetical protein [Beijerinckiaceae bacterium]